MMSDADSDADVVEVKPIAGIGTKVFGKWDASEVTCRDPGLAPYINLTTVGVPHTGGRHANAWFGNCLLYTSPSPRDGLLSRMPSSA